MGVPEGAAERLEGDGQEVEPRLGDALTVKASGTMSYIASGQTEIDVRMQGEKGIDVLHAGGGRYGKYHGSTGEGAGERLGGHVQQVGSRLGNRSGTEVPSGHPPHQ